jgi:hypothetical protein
MVQHHCHESCLHLLSIIVDATDGAPIQQGDHNLSSQQLPCVSNGQSAEKQNDQQNN